jgi:tRNA A37 methylthiotransferase MiaB
MARTAWKYTRHLGPATTARIIKGRIRGQKEYSLKISQGCNFKCTFCSIPKAIGGLVSRPLAEVVREAEQAVAEGYDTVTLIADEAGSFGIDNKERFLDLMDQLTGIDGLVELNLSDLNAAWLVKYGEKLLRCFERKNILRLEIPIQSGSQEVVDKMRRGYELERVKERLLELKSRCPYLHLHTHLIAGFPSETGKDIEQSIDFVSEVGFDTGHVMMYSERPGAPATTMANKLPPQEKERAMIHYFDRLAASNYSVEFQGDRHEAIYFSLN